MAGELSFFELGVEDAERGRRVLRRAVRLELRGRPRRRLRDLGTGAGRHARRRPGREPVPVLRRRRHRRRGREGARARRHARGDRRRRRPETARRGSAASSSAATTRARRSDSTSALVNETTRRAGRFEVPLRPANRPPVLGGGPCTSMASLFATHTFASSRNLGRAGDRCNQPSRTLRGIRMNAPQSNYIPRLGGRRRLAVRANSGRMRCATNRWWARRCASRPRQAAARAARGRRATSPRIVHGAKPSHDSNRRRQYAATRGTEFAGGSRALTRPAGSVAGGRDGRADVSDAKGAARGALRASASTVADGAAGLSPRWPRSLRLDLRAGGEPIRPARRHARARARRFPQSAGNPRRALCQ